MSTCTSHWNATKHRTCIGALAAGWINAPDLCPNCTLRFMAALDAVEPDLDWHDAYRQRAESGEVSAS
jgi:hypothetical protein